MELLLSVLLLVTSSDGGLDVVEARELREVLFAMSIDGLPVLSDVGAEESPNAISLLGTHEPVGTHTVAITWAYVAAGLQSDRTKTREKDFMVTGKRP